MAGDPRNFGSLDTSMPRCLASASDMCRMRHPERMRRSGTRIVTLSFSGLGFVIAESVALIGGRA